MNVHTELYFSEEFSSSGSFNCNRLRGALLKIIELLFEFESSNSVDNSRVL